MEYLPIRTGGECCIGIVMMTMLVVSGDGRVVMVVACDKVYESFQQVYPNELSSRAYKRLYILLYYLPTLQHRASIRRGKMDFWAAGNDDVAAVQ